jgi:diguanylate cyclase (GGDEF)-like protein/PAS domain S-box-containing protein
MVPQADLLNEPDFYRRLVEEAEEGVWVIDAQNRLIYVNRRMAMLLGGSKEALLNRALWDFMDADTRVSTEARLKRRRAGESESYELMLQRLDGGQFCAELSAAPLFDQGGMFCGSFAFVSDVSWRKAAERAIGESERAFREVFERSQAVKLMIDPQSGSIVAANRAARAYYGYSEAEFLSVNIKQINVLEPEAIASEMARAKREERNYFVFRHRLKNGEEHDVEVHSNPIQVGGRSLLYSIIHDIDRQRSAERELRRIQFVVEQAHLSVVLIDASGRIRYANAGTARLLGRLRTEVIGRFVWEFVPALKPERWPELWRRTKVALEQRFRSTARQTGTGDVHIEVQASHMAFDGEEFVVAYSRDIGDQVRAEGLLALQHDVLEQQAAGYPLDHVLLQMVLKLEALVPSVRATILLLHDDHLYHCVGPSMPDAYLRAVDGLPIGPTMGSCGTAAYYNRPVECPDIANDPLWADAKELAEEFGIKASWSTPIRASDGRVIGTFALYYMECRSPDNFHRQIVEACTHLAGIAIEHREAESRVHSLAFFDPLTGLPNRSLLSDRVELALAAAQREGSALALIFLDLDRFKTINDTLGHAVGDRLLQSMAARLNAAVRESDTVCRLGGDEFVLLLPDCDANGAVAVAEKLIAAAAEHFDIDGMALNASASLGIALYPDDGSDYDTLLKHADTAMYRAKERGRNAYCFYRHDMNQNAAERLEVESALRNAVQRGELRLHYQPQVRIEDGHVYGLEALVRWQHPQWGMVSPARFIPVAEESGLIDAVGEWVLNEACRQMAQWRDEATMPPRVAVNLSARQFRQGSIPALVRNTLGRYGLPPSVLTLEITESLMMERDDDATKALRELDEMGVALAVDDFGTGYSSLGYLKRFPVSELKLDQSFLSEDPEDRALASAVVRIGQSLKLTVVAEGVETAEQLTFLHAEGCAVAQGYHFARPMPAKDMENWLSGRQLVAC